MSKKRIKVKISRNQLILLAIACVLIVCAVYYFYFLKPIKSWNYYGIELNFKADLREADKIYVADEASVYNLLWDREVKNVTIIFTNTSDMGLVAVEAFEIAYKLRLAQLILKRDINVTSREVPSFDMAFLNSLCDSTALIALIPPSVSNETGIRAENCVIFISAKSKSDFDLVTTKFIIIALGIKL
ncbi:MAG: hypothetical protein QMD12_02550 [Candidatus Aenigmarchaeota archaeon]|nr:hypothetical protein [Candidatus Aenigmarchaeota archaeon]